MSYIFINPPKKLMKAIVILTGLLASSLASATTYHGVEFSDGEISFADSIVDYNPAYTYSAAVPGKLSQNTSKALGTPDYLTGGPKYVSLGDGGRLTLRFTNNWLTGSGNDTLDLWIFEIGSIKEAMTVDISKDGLLWHNVGEVIGGTSGIDIDHYGFGKTDFFSYVRLTDIFGKDETTCSTQKTFDYCTIGADIDAVGASSSVAAIPAPAPIWLLSPLLPLATLSGKRNKALWKR